MLKTKNKNLFEKRLIKAKQRHKLKADISTRRTKTVYRVGQI